MLHSCLPVVKMTARKEIQSEILHLHHSICPRYSLDYIFVICISKFGNFQVEFSLIKSRIKCSCCWTQGFFSEFMKSWLLRDMWLSHDTKTKYLVILQNMILLIILYSIQHLLLSAFNSHFDYWANVTLAKVQSKIKKKRKKKNEAVRRRMHE